MINELVLQLYSQGLSLREIGDATGHHPQALRKALIKAGLAIKKRDRDESFDAFNGRESTTPIGENDTLLTDKLRKLENSLQHSRNELNFHRAVKRSDVREDFLVEHLTNIVNDVVGSIKVPETHVTISEVGRYDIPDWGLMAVISDIHLGEVVGDDVPDNTYNYEIAEKRLDHFVQKLFDNPQQSKNLVIADLKDILKGVIHGGMWETEGSVIESIAKAVELYTKMIKKLAAVYESVRIYTTGSNHERLTDYIVTTNKHLDYGRLIDMMLLQIMEASGLDNVSIHTTDTGYNMLNLNGANIVMMHGDTHRTYKPTVVGSRSKLQDTCLQIFQQPYRHAISGHTHEFIASGNQYKGLNIVNGTMVGNTSYGLQSGYSAIVPTQTILFVEGDGSVENVKAVQFWSV